MDPIPLPEYASMQDLAVQAVLFRDLVRSGDKGMTELAQAISLGLPGSPDLSPAGLSTFSPTDAELLVSRMYGASSWQELHAQVQLMTEHTFTPSTERPEVRFQTESFSALACIQYTDSDPAWPERVRRADGLVGQDPTLVAGSVDMMAAAGDSSGLVREIATRPECVNEHCGPLGWPPLLYAVYSRAGTKGQSWSLLDSVAVLLEAGADPNVGFLWRGLVPPFTALTGALGGGERGESRHADGLAIARLLLAAGADPNDGQAVYNNGVGAGAAVAAAPLEILVEFGLGGHKQGPWYQRFGARLHAPDRLLTEAKRAMSE